jgi:aminoglycoside phosphotransferase (APT) family kinase protein
MARERLARLAAAGRYAENPAVDRLLAAGEDLGPAPGPPVICHGDLHARHLLVDGEGTATGVIDWGDLCLADPAVDLSLAYGGFTGAARRELLAAYSRPVGPDRELRARVLAVFLCAVLAEYAADVGARALLADSLAGLTRATED